MNKLKIACHLDTDSGFGMMNAEIIREFLKRMEVSIQVLSSSAPVAFPPDLEKYISPAKADTALMIHVPSMSPVAERHVRLSMWESTGLRPSWKNNLNAADAVCCPNEMNAISWMSSGVTAPVVKIPLFTPPAWHGVAMEKTYSIGDPFVFASGGKTWHNRDRKGFELLLAAFERVNAMCPYTRLKLKVSKTCTLPPITNPNVHVEREHLSEDGLKEWMREAHAFVCTSHAGGWEFMPLQAMATGLTVITSKFSGMGEYANESCAYIVPHSYAPAAEPYGGHWASMEICDVEMAMLKAMFKYSGDAHIRNNGIMQSRRLTVKSTVDILEEVLHRYSIIA